MIDAELKAIIFNKLVFIELRKRKINIENRNLFGLKLEENRE